MNAVDAVPGPSTATAARVVPPYRSRRGATTAPAATTVAERRNSRRSSDPGRRATSTSAVSRVVMMGAMAEQSSTTTRLEAFSDGVLAIAITLLIIEVHVPHVGRGKLADALAEQWPVYASYVVSFLIIGIIWVNHHGLFEHIARVDRRLLFVNLMLLLGVAFLPFPTALLADYVDAGGANAHIAAAVYGLTMTVIGLSFQLLWLHLERHPELLVDGFDADAARRARLGSAAGPVVYAASIGVAFVSAIACLALYALMAIYFVFDWRTRAPTGGSAGVEEHR
jgi:uncharacterized membrane protein